MHITWLELQEILKSQGYIGPDEEIKGLTLVKPRRLLVRTELRKKEKED